MKNRTFMIILSILIGVGTVLTIAHLGYVVYAYQHCSIIEFIARELW